jgi:hypothetical protein
VVSVIHANALVERWRTHLVLEFYSNVLKDPADGLTARADFIPRMLSSPHAMSHLLGTGGTRIGAAGNTIISSGHSSVCRQWVLVSCLRPRWPPELWRRPCACCWSFLRSCVEAWRLVRGNFGEGGSRCCFVGGMEDNFQCVIDKRMSEGVNLA